jgi:type I restriction enzyme R subunit
MTKKPLSESDICDQFITPAIHAAGWDKTTQIRREYTFTDGRVFPVGSKWIRGIRKRADYVLLYEANLPLAVIEAKDNTHAPGAGLEQALAYAEALDIPFVFSSNGDAFVMHDRVGPGPKEVDVPLESFPSPADLWKRYRAWKGLDAAAEKVVRFPFHDDGSGKEPRYYQRIAVQRTIEAVVRGQRRVLLVMATGTGKTYTAFQIIWRLWKAGTVGRVLFLADRNVLIEQTKNNDFKPFGSTMTWVRNRTVDTAFEVYLTLYQAVTGNEEDKNVYKQFSRDFFDLIVIDECHRGSAREESAWREILDYFQSAIQLGLTATPKETDEVSTLTYFGDPVYTYSLKQGIDDGFLAPYKVVRVDLDRDLQGWRPPKGMRDDLDHEIEDRIYNQRDMDRVLVLNERTKRVAQRIVEYMLATDPFGKTIVFCEDIDHAVRMRTALVNEVALRMPDEAATVTKFVVRITGDSEEGKSALYDFTHPEKRYPVIATTSKLLTTGVDAKTVKLVVLDQRIQSMIEFKQIVGRGTRIHEETGKTWFTVMDFKKATELFADPAFDGDPVVIYSPQPGQPVAPPEPPVTTGPGEGPGGEGPDPRPKFVVSGVKVGVLAERVQYLDRNGRLITESLTDYTKTLVTDQYATVSEFLRRWRETDRKAAIVDELLAQGLLLDELRAEVGPAGANLDPFDLLCHVVYDRPPLTRRERADQVRKRDVYTQFGEQARAVLDVLLEKYADEGVVPAGDLHVLRVQPLNAMGTPLELIKRFGTKDAFVEALRKLEDALYDPDAPAQTA